ncbi:MAG: 30S ribosome-binding factor RbfA [Chlamydiia bacterium]|nr:30S ribosome-binding factor RbfA [Chlamydiia bacterium]
MESKRIKRVNSLLKEVISEVIRRDVQNPHISQFLTITGVDVAKDLHHAIVHVSVMGPDLEKNQTIEALNNSAGYISSLASKQVVLRFFPSLKFKLDTSLDEHMRIEELIQDIQQKRDEQQSS